MDASPESAHPASKVAAPEVEVKQRVQFEEMTFGECERADGLRLQVDLVRDEKLSLHLPDEMEAIAPSESFLTKLEKIHKYWIIDNRMSRRTLIDAFVSELLNLERNPGLRGAGDIGNGMEFENLQYSGTIDYVICRSTSIAELNAEDLCFLIMTMRTDWQASIPEILGHAGCVMRRRQAAGLNSLIFFVLSDGMSFQFFVMDSSGRTFTRPRLMVNLDTIREPAQTQVLSQILAWLSWFLLAAHATMSRTQDELLEQMRGCLEVDDNRVKRRSGCDMEQ